MKQFLSPNGSVLTLRRYKWSVVLLTELFVLIGTETETWHLGANFSSEGGESQNSDRSEVCAYFKYLKFLFKIS